MKAPSRTELQRMPVSELETLASELVSEVQQDRQENALEYYTPANPDAEPAHYSKAREVALIGGHRAAKSDTMLAEMVIQMTGVVPASLVSHYPLSKLRPPIRARLFCTSFQNAFDVQLKRKLQWFEWDGQGIPGSDRGHWGWVPRRFLINNSWDQSWSEKHRRLTLNNGSFTQIMSYEQESSDVKVGSFHFIGEDEIPPEHFHRQNRTRIMETHGQLWTAATPPDDRGTSLSSAWFYDQVYVPGITRADPEIFAVQLRTDRNRLLLAQDIEWLAKGMTSDQKDAQLTGVFLHLSGRVFPEFADLPRTWCFKCDTEVHAIDGQCQQCAGDDLDPYCHVIDNEPLPTTWPRCFYGDPHPRRPLAGIWVAVSPNDDWYVEHEIDVDPYGGPMTVRQAIEDYEARHDLRGSLIWRKLDSQMTKQHNEFAGQDWTIGKALRDVGFEFMDANVSKETGYAILRDAMRCTPWTRKPRLRVMRRCQKVIHQMTHYAWAEHTIRAIGRAEREIEQEKNSDFPAALRFMANDNLTHAGLQATMRHEPIRYAAGAGASKRTGY